MHEHARPHPVVPTNTDAPPGPARARAHRLELFFDLVFVVAVSIAAVQLHHALTEGHVAEGVLSYAMLFFAIWWAWMNFTWFGTSFATDDWLYRVLTIVQMAACWSSPRASRPRSWRTTSP